MTSNKILKEQPDYSDLVNLNNDVEIRVNIEHWYIKILDKKTGREVFIQPWKDDGTNCSISLLQNDNSKQNDSIELDYIERSTET